MEGAGYFVVVMVWIIGEGFVEESLKFAVVRGEYHRGEVLGGGAGVSGEGAAVYDDIVVVFEFVEGVIPDVLRVCVCCAGSDDGGFSPFGVGFPEGVGDGGGADSLDSVKGVKGGRIGL